MRAFLIILVIIVVIGIAGYLYGKRAIDNFEFGEPKFVGADLQSIFSGAGFTTLDLSSTIVNKNNFEVPVKGLYVELKYKGQLIAKSTNPQDFVIPANGSITITHNLTLPVGTGFAIDIGLQLASKKQLEFQYSAKGSLFGFIPLSTKDTFTYP